jgi:hypothetical protein
MKIVISFDQCNQQQKRDSGVKECLVIPKTLKLKSAKVLDSDEASAGLVVGIVTTIDVHIHNVLNYSPL